MLAYPTPRFNASTILEGPSYRPLGRGSMNVYEPQPEAMTPECKVNRHTKNGGFVGNFCKNVPRDNQFMNKHYNPLDGTPLSVPGSVGNVGDQAISMRPTMAEPKNEQLRLIMNILNGKVDMKDPGLGLSAKMVESLGGKFKSEDAVVSFADDFTNTQQTMRRQVRIDNAMKQGFSKQEAEAAYDELRTEEAKKAMFLQQNASVRLYDLLDSKLGGTQDGRVRSNDESALSLAKGENAVAVRQSQKMNEKLDVAIAAAYGNFRRGQVAERSIPKDIFQPSSGEPFLAATGRPSAAGTSAYFRPIARFRGRGPLGSGPRLPGSGGGSDDPEVFKARRVLKLKEGTMGAPERPGDPVNQEKVRRVLKLKAAETSELKRIMALKGL